MKHETTISNIANIANTLFAGQTTSPIPASPHQVYLTKLDKNSRDLLRLRDERYEGNWDALSRVVSSVDRPRIDLLRAYEDSHHVDLGEYLRESA